MEVIRPARGLFLDFPMGRSMGRPNDPELQNQVIRAAFKLFEAPVGPVLEDFPEIIPVRDGRMGYALPPELVLGIDDIGEVSELLAEVQAEVENLREDYVSAVAFRNRTTVGASGLSYEQYAPFIAEFVRGNIPKSPRQGLPAIPMLKLVVEDLEEELSAEFKSLSLTERNRLLSDARDVVEGILKEREEGGNF